MAEELYVVELRNEFYRDSFGKVIIIMLSILTAIGLVIAVSVYLYLNKPKPITFAVVDNEWRIQPQVPLDQPYLSTPDLLQWVGEIMQKVFVFDFDQYNDQLQSASQYFTPDGWKMFLNQLNIYANYNTVQGSKLFVNGVAAGAPAIIQQGLLSGRYAWWVRFPLIVNYDGQNPPLSKALTLQVLVVRVSTLNNLTGVAIDNVIVANNTTNPTPVGTT